MRKKLIIGILCILIGTFPAFAQQKVSGTVTDARGDALAGVSIVEKGATSGTITDADGKFTVTVSQGAVLHVSYIGYVAQEITVGNQTQLQITMEEDLQLLDEVVVVGYGTVNKKNLTTAISKVKPENISKAANSSMAQLLVGQAAGLQATVNSAQPGGWVNLSIRGSGMPLFVVDGVIMPTTTLEPGAGALVTPNYINRSGLAGINPEDIESIEILKDASAAIYGIGAANGVILVTTKKGTAGNVKINYEGNVSSVRNYSLPRPLNAQEYMNYVNIFNKEAYLYNNKFAPYGDKEYASGWSPVFDETEIANAQSTNWLSHVLQNGSISNHTLTLSGGSKNIQYYLSGNYFDQTGTVINSGMERYSIKSHIAIQVAPFLKFSAGINYNQNNYKNSPIGGIANNRGTKAAGALQAALRLPSCLPVKDENGNYTLFIDSPNPAAMTHIEDNTQASGANILFTADVNIVKDMLSLKLLYGNNSENAHRSTYIPSYVYFDQMYKSRGNLGENRLVNQTMEATLMFSKNMANIVNTDIVLGVGRYLDRYSGMNVSYDEQYDAIGNDDIGAASGVYTPSSYRAENEKRSQFLRANFDILNRYVIAGTVRRDGTDKFFPGKKYAWFPSVSLAWKLSNEAFLSDISWLNLLKIRASYGKTGSDNLGSSLYGSYSPTGTHVLFDYNAQKYVPIVVNGVDYPDVTWEKTIMKNAGIDFYVFNNRLSGSFDLFRNDITDRLGYDNTAGLSMFAAYPINGSHIRRQGWDASLNSKNIILHNFSWTSLLTFTKYQSLWIERMPNYDYNLYEKRGVVTTNAWYYYKTNGIINADKSNMPASQPVEAQIPGYPILVDKNGDGEITVDDVEMWDTTPDLYFGLGNTFRYKNFDLDIFLYSQLGVEKYNYALDWANPLDMASNVSNSNIYADRIWNSQTNPNGTLPGVALFSSVSLPGGVGTDIHVQDASFVRVRNITLGYNLNGSSLGFAGNHIDNIRIYLDAQNPFVFTKFEGTDPEIATGRGQYPQTRIFSLGFKLSFK
ncbi:MAG: SusC/RagA family TonB-linked outer membrane protein [Dysgonamonadaceae bacterium]|jgi:TonB-linked SusC/RagA family outer membrane protein|nr:SusC/RagA family TonB-linked outer membrane protein [Dysgonamonadaceae bacterium]